MRFRIALPILFLLISGVTTAYAFPTSIPAHDIQIEFDLKAHAIKAVENLKVYRREEGEIVTSINRNMTVTSVKGADGRELSFSVKEGDEEKNKLTISLPASATGEAGLKIAYTGRFTELPGDIRFTREFVSNKAVAYVGEDMILLDGSSCWYPCIDGPATFRVTATTPAGYEVVMEGTRLARREEKGMVVTTWDFTHPASGIYLVGGRYVVTEDRYNDIALYTYLFPEDIHLSGTYMEYTKKYLEIYERLLGKYPFKKFAVVENILPTGFGMPSYTLLGQSVIRLPFIVKTSLGHEIAHNWWGNSVYPDYESGNWSEGLTVYMADYLYEEMDGKGPSYRNQLLRDYTNYVDLSKEYPLTEFKNRIRPEDRAIGYGKGMYVFHMLRVMLGDDMFYRGLREVITNRSFRSTSWEDFRAAFEKVSGRELGWFFRQWVRESGAPEIRLGEVVMRKHEKGYTIKAGIIQVEKAYELYLPVLIETGEGPSLTYHWIKRLNNTLEIDLPSKPRAIIVDPYYDVFRRLNPEEVPPTLSKFMGARNRLIVLPSAGDSRIIGAYSKVASDMDEVPIKTDKDVTEEELKRNSLFILGGPGENVLVENIISRLPPDIKIEKDTISISGKAYDRKDSVLVVAMSNPYHPGSTLLLFSGYNPDYIASVGERIYHYGKYSYLLFMKGENVEKGTWEATKIEKTFPGSINGGGDRI